MFNTKIDINLCYHSLPTAVDRVRRSIAVARPIGHELYVYIQTVYITVNKYTSVRALTPFNSLEILSRYARYIMKYDGYKVQCHSKHLIYVNFLAFYMEVYF